MARMDLLRVCRFAPYRRGMGPVFTLTLWDTFETARDGKTILAYRLTMTDMERSPLGAAVVPSGKRPIVLFEGEDFYVPVMESIDSDSTVRSLMAFLTLRPGDTDADFFASDNEVQRAYREQHAESLSWEVTQRFGED